MNEKLDALRRRIENEHNLVNQRLSWLVASQAFLLTAFAISLNAPTGAMRPDYARANHLLVSLLPYVGLACIFILWLTVAGAIWSMTELRARADAIIQPEDLPIYSRAAIRRLGLAAPVAIPGVFLLLWLVLLIAP